MYKCAVCNKRPRKRPTFCQSVLIEEEVEIKESISTEKKETITIATDAGPALQIAKAKERNA